MHKLFGLTSGYASTLLSTLFYTLWFSLRHQTNLPVLHQALTMNQGPRRLGGVNLRTSTPTKSRYSPPTRSRIC